MRVLPDGHSIRASGEVDRRLRLGIERITADPSIDRDFVLEDIARVPGYERQFEEWCGDISGRFVGLFASIASFTGELHPRLPEYVREIARLQKPDGRFGVDSPLETIDFAMIWGHGRLLIGLLEYWLATGDEVGLSAARRLGDYYRHTLKYWRSDEAVEHERYMFYCQGLEGMVALFRATRDPGYLEVARTMAAGIRAIPWWHSHGYLSALRGALDLYDVTDEPHLLDFVRARSAEIAANHLLPDGTPPELFPWSLRDEGCSTADWLRLQLHLGQITGDTSYFDSAEIALLNGLFGNQSHLGGFCHHQFAPASCPSTTPRALETDTTAMGAHLDNCFQLGYTGLGVDAWWCCVYHGTLAIYHAIRHTFGWDDRSVFVNLGLDARARLPHPAGPVDLEQSTDYQGPARFRIQVHDLPRADLQLRFRIPGWAQTYTLACNGTVINGSRDGGYVGTGIPLRTGDVIELVVPLGIRIQQWRAERREMIISYGPYLLVPEVSGGHVSALALPGADESGFIPLPRLKAPKRPWTIPSAHFAAIGLGQEMGDQITTIGRSRPEVVRLRPLSEQTAFPIVPPTALGLPIFLISPRTQLADELTRAMRGSALLEKDLP